MSSLSISRLFARGRALWCGVAVALCLLGLSGAAMAYPQYAAKGEFSCISCHYSPTGGGLINSWGRQSRDASFEADDSFGGDPDTWWGHDDATLNFSSKPSTLTFDVGAEGRLVALAGQAAVLVPMLLEAGGVASYGRWQIYGTGTYRKGTPALPLVAQSREHWLMYGLSEEWFVRAGKLVLPFGLRTPDHTQYVREDFGFGPWGQSYGVELDWVGERASLSAAAFAGDLVSVDAQLREQGGVVRASYQVADQVEVALSALVARSDAKEGWSGAASLRWQPLDSAYVLGEAALQERSSRQSDVSLQTRAGFVRAGYFVLPALDVHLEVGTRQIEEAAWLSRSRVAIGGAWQAWHWLELTPQVLVERTDDMGNLFTGLLQAHLLY